MNHRIFERTLRPLVFRRARLFECHVHLNPSAFWLTWIGFGSLLALIGSALLEYMSEQLACVAGVIVFIIGGACFTGLLSNRLLNGDNFDIFDLKSGGTTR